MDADTINCPKCAGIMCVEKHWDFFTPVFLARCLLCGLRCDKVVLANRKLSEAKGMTMPRFHSEESKQAWVEKCRRTRALRNKNQGPFEVPAVEESEKEGPMTPLRHEMDKLKAVSWPSETEQVISDSAVADREAMSRLDLAIQKVLEDVAVLQRAKEILARHPIGLVTSV